MEKEARTPWLFGEDRYMLSVKSSFKMIGSYHDEDDIEHVNGKVKCGKKKNPHKLISPQNGSRVNSLLNTRHQLKSKDTTFIPLFSSIRFMPLLSYFPVKFNNILSGICVIKPK